MRGVKALAKGVVHPEPPFRIVEENGVKTLTPTQNLPQIVPEVQHAKTIDDVREILRNKQKNKPARVADQIARSATGMPHDPRIAPPASLEKQSGIARVFGAAVEGSPEYKHALFERYGNTMPQVVEKTGAQNYDQLTEAAYRKLAEETKQQFEQLPVRTTFHPGDREYATPSAMMKDVLGEGNLNVYRGGDSHEFLGAVDPETGLSSNEMFRAVHDAYGHVPGGQTFRPAGEEAAYASHAQMFTPAARMAALSETRGQNSFVNYSPLNAGIVTRMEDIKAQIAEINAAKRLVATEPEWGYKHREAKALLANSPLVSDLNARLREVGSQWKYAPQKPVLLPPEYLPAETAGGVPSYLKPVIQPVEGTALSSRGVHMSQQPDLTETDPRFYGTGHQGAEREFGPRRHPRSYFYLGEEGTVNPESLFAERTPYEAQLSGLYDLAADPVGLRALAEAWRREGRPDDSLDRLLQEYGYSGLVGSQWAPGQHPAYVFKPTPVRKLQKKPGNKGYAEGGRVNG